MSIDATGLGSFGDLATALGLLGPTGQPNASWFGDPVGGGDPTTGNGLKHLMSDTGQREALTRFVDQVLGPPDALTRSGAQWVPLFRETSPAVTVFAVVEPVGTEVHLGVGVEHTTVAGPPTVTSRVHVPLFRFADRGGTLGAADSLPAWLLLGRVGGDIEIGVDATFSDAAPPPGEASLGGVGVKVTVPTAGADVGFAMTLRDLQLPGTPHPRTFTLDASSPEQLGSGVLDLIAGLVRAQAEALDLSQPALKPFGALAGMLGLRDVADLPPFPLADLPTQGVQALVGWVEQVLADGTARDAWLGQVAALVDGDLEPDRDAVSITLGPLTLTIGLRVEAGTGGHPVLVPWVELALDTRAGARVRAAVDLMRADTATGACTAIPDVRLEAVFGVLAGGTALVTGTDPHVGSLRVGIGLDATHRPVFTLTAHDVKVGGPTHDVVDLSTPDAALAAGSSLVSGAITAALAGLGPAGALVARIIGLDPPAGVSGLDAAGLVSDPVAAVRAYWAALVASPAATADVLGRVAALLTGGVAVDAPGLGTAVAPWRVDLVGPLGLVAWRDGTALRVELAATVDVPVLGDLVSITSLRLALAVLDPAAGRVTFAAGATASSRLARADGAPMRLGVADIALVAQDLAVELVWLPSVGLRAQVRADGLELEVDEGVSAGLAGGGPDSGVRIPVPLPSLDASGRLAWAGPDWDAVERALAVLIGRLGVPEIAAAVELLGWSGGSASRLALSALLSGDADALRLAVETWLADLLLDCDRVRHALGPVSALLSGFSVSAPLGTGNSRDPYRCPVAGEPRAPGLRVWLDPGCAVGTGDRRLDVAALLTAEPPEPETVAHVLRASGSVLPDVGELMVGRDSLGDGLRLLLARWTGTDGLVAAPSVLPDGVSSLVLEGRSYDELVALGSTGALAPQVLDPTPAAVVHVGCEATWVMDRAAGTFLDLSGATVPTAAASTVPAAGPGTWFVRLPEPSVAALARPDRGAVGEQAARLADVLAGRTEAVVLVGYGAAGAAVVRAAAGLAAVSDVVTVGAPWGPLAIDSLRSGLGGDALRLLGLLARNEVPAWPEVVLGSECTPLQRLRLTVARSRSALASTFALPDVGAETRRAGLAVHAVFGEVEGDDLGRGLGAFVADGITARATVAETAPVAAATALHAALDLPVFDLDLGGLLIGVGAAVELLRVGRAAPGPGIDLRLVRAVVVEVHLGVHDGWLLGGPGSTGAAGDVRWMSARVEVPLDGTQGASELVLHEARGLGVDRERWVVRGDGDGVAATVAVPEVRVLLSGVLGRLRAASPDLAALLSAFGLVRDGGLDPDGLDRLLHDPAITLRGLLAGSAPQVAAALRALVPVATGTGTEVSWAVGAATLGLDLATGSVTGHLRSDPGLVAAVDLAVTAGAAGAHATLTVGSLDPDTGGVRLVVAGTGPLGSGAATTPPVTAVVEWAGAHGGSTRTVPLWPALDTDGLTDLAGVLLPALGLRGLAATAITQVSAQARPLLEQALHALGLLPVGSDGIARLRLPVAAVADPAGWLAGLARSGSVDAAAAAVALLDALAPLVVPGRGADPGWPLADGVRVDYAATAGRLRLAVHADLTADLGGRTVTTALVAGALIGPGAAPVPVVDLAVDVDGHGLELALDPTLRLALVRPAPAAPLPLYPDGPGLGQALSTVAGSVLPLMLDELAGLSGSPAGLRRDVGVLVTQLGDALLLREAGKFAGARITDLADHPETVLLGRLPALAGAAAAALVPALDPAGTLVRALTPSTGVVTIELGTAGSVSVTLDSSGPTPAVVLRAAWTLPGVGVIALEELRLSAAGVVVAVRVGPVPVDLGSFSLRPMLVVRAGSAVGSDRLLSLGLGLDDAATRSVEMRWGLSSAPPVLLAVTRNDKGVVTRTSEPDAPVWLLSVALSLAGGVVIDGLGPILSTRVVRMLRGVLLVEGATDPEVDPAFIEDLLDADALLARLERLLWNVATDAEPLAVTLGGLVTIAVAHDGDGTSELLGLSVSLAPNRRFLLADGSTKVELEVDASWLDPAVAPGLSIYAVRGVRTAGAPDTYAFSLEPAVTVAGLGVRFTNTAGPLLSLGPVSLDGIALHLYGQAGVSGLGGGVQLELAGLSFAPSAGGGTNGVANAIMSDAGKSSPASRPSFSPSVAVQKHPSDTKAKVSLRAGTQPGPWWVVVQRQLGPLYLERVGLDTAETDGRVSRVTLMFDGRVEIFGLTAAVDQLSLSWLGGDLLDVHSWAVDLQGLAVSADMAGAVLAGGMLKTTDNGVVSYVGMLLGRFGIYGLTVFGGYTNDAGNPSFFVFGAVNGPIGGPPAFFITGLGGGLGINRKLVIPDDPRQFPSYPFIMALDPYAAVPDPMDTLRSLGVYFGPERGTFWFAAGISFTCFSLVDGIAVLAVSFGGAGLEINLMGLARLALPNPAAALVSIELGLLARISTREGVFMIRAALTDNSWLLYSDVRLTGGFAFVVWWKGSLAGQFVLTIGGYHPDFHRDGYPDVPRVGLCWQVSDNIVIKGGAYFALTSEALMAGVSVEAVADFGWAWIRAKFGADGIVYFDPFWFDVSIYATISAGVEIDCFFGTISFSITTGAHVHVWGPEFSGEAGVEVGPCSVTVPFGAQRKHEGITQEWPGFVTKYLEDAGNGHARALSAITGRGTLPAATGGGRSAPTPDGSAERPYEVFAEFELSIVTSMPASRFDIGAADVVPVAVVRSDGAPFKLGLSPMGASGLVATLQVRLRRLDQATGTWKDDDADLAQLADNAASGSPRPEGSRITTGAFPIGVWGPPTPAAAAGGLPTGDVLMTGNQVTLVAEASQMSPGPLIDYYKVESERRPLPLSAVGSERAALITAGDAVVLPPSTSVAQVLAAAAARLFAEQPVAVTDGPMLRGNRSNLARACYAGDVSAPPMFGTLTDGLAVAGAANVRNKPAPEPAAAMAYVVQEPRVLAYLTGGTKVAERSAGTTVTDGELRRRTAPTLDSVQARLGRHLPVSLDVALPPGGAVGRTFAPTAMPRTGAPGSARSYGLARGPAADRVLGLSGIGGVAPKGVAAKGVRGLRSGSSGRAAAGADDGRTPTLAAGDVVVLHAPDHAVGVEPGGRGPSLRLSGGARVTMLRGDGAVLLDTVVADSVPVAAGTALAAVQADGSLEVLDGLAGWHSRSRIACLGSGAALAAGCVLVVREGITPVGAGWTTAGELVRDSSEVTTRFSVPVSTVVVVVEADDPDRVQGLGLELSGAARSLGADGRPVDPALLVNGTQAVAVYAVVPDPGAAAVVVRIVPGGDWRPTGVLGGTVPVAEVVAGLVRDGVTGSTGRLLAVAGPGCTPTWASGRPAPKRAPSVPKKTITPQKTTAKKAAAKKVVAKRTVAKRTVAKTTAAKKTTTRGGARRGRS